METTRSSIGVELEFLLCVAESNLPMNTPERFQNAGAPFVLPPGVGRYDIIVDRVRKRLGRTIENTLSSLRGLGDRVINSDEEAVTDIESLHLRPYSNWTVGTDPTIHLPSEMEEEEKYLSEYRWYPTEVASPALWATETSWEEIRAVVQAIKDEFWIITPPSAGMHYHYGHGKDYIPFRKLRRMAALLVAVDPLMVQLHPEYRRNSSYCLSNRLYSRIAHGRRAAVTSRDLGAKYIEERPEVPGVGSRPNPFSQPFRKRTPNLIVPFKRGELTGYEFSEDIFMTLEYDEHDGGEARPLEIPLAVSEILQSVNAPTLAELMRVDPEPDDRPAYNFRAYTLNLYKLVLRRGGEVNIDYQNKRTVEFRQMASTMEPEEVIAHGKIIVRLCEFAAEVDLPGLWKVALDCTVAEVNGDWFDVFDLLAELGLVPEAKILQHAVARFRGEKVPDELMLDDKGE
ncbi:hypothetical protein F5Y12DRAFT_793728 [Xylaria sp. FL1777]|nr:hypothetical protein F5Y12DRAFT_793728 [Xylaria sp. FL1777]